MRSSRTKKHAAIEPNLTSLIDVTFLLIVFFVLVSKIAEVENVEMDLPSPFDAAASEVDAALQASVSVIPGEDGSIAGYRVGLLDFAPDKAGLEAMTSHLAARFSVNPGLHVNIRADRTTHYRHIEPVIGAVAAAARSGGAAPEAAAHVNLMVTRQH